MAQIRQSGDRWTECENEYMCVGAEIYYGRLAQAAAQIPEAIVRAERVGHYDAVWALKNFATHVTAARGYLAAAERELREAWEFGQAHRVAWSFVSPVTLSEFVFGRGELAEAEELCSDPSGVEPKTFLAGSVESLRFCQFARSGDQRAAEAWAKRRWKLDSWLSAA